MTAIQLFMLTDMSQRVGKLQLLNKIRAKGKQSSKTN